MDKAPLLDKWYMLATEMAYEMKVCVSKVGAHPANREGQMIIIRNVHANIEMVTTDGWNDGIFKGWLMEKPPGAKGDALQQANARLIKNSGGRLADSPTSLMIFFTVMGNHMTQTMRCLKFGCNSTLEDISANGILERGTIKDRQPSLIEPIEHGLGYMT